jgi:arylsulfatase A-like enzyme
MSVNTRRSLATGRPAKPTVDDAIEFITTKRDTSRPFSMYLGLAGPHDPRLAPPKYRRLYDPDKIPIPPNFQPYHPYDNGHTGTIRDEKLETWPRTEEAIRRHLYDYYALISSMDYDIGRLLDALEETGLDTNTLIIFSSDQGLALGSHGLMGKQSLYEDVMKVPFLVSGPGVPVGKTDALAYLFDIPPTIYEYAGITIPKGLDGVSLMPVIRGDTDKVRDRLFMAYKTWERSVRDDTWKLIRYPQINVSRLYNLKSDPREIVDLANNAEHREVANTMMDLMEEEQKRYGDKTPLTSASPGKAAFTPPHDFKPGRTGGEAPRPFPEDM